MSHLITWVIYCRYVKKQSLYHHLKQHVPDKIVCMECGYISNNSDEHADHSTKHIKDKPWKCNKCNEKFSRRQQYLIHMKVKYFNSLISDQKIDRFAGPYTIWQTTNVVTLGDTDKTEVLFLY